MTLDELYLYVQNRLKTDTMQAVADDLKISKPAVRRLGLGIKPGAKLIAALNLEPSRKLQHTRSRRERLNTIARALGFASWSNYETHMLKENL